MPAAGPRRRESFGGPRSWVSALRCRGCCRPRNRRGGAVHSRPTGCASWNPACPGPRGSDLCVRPLFSPDVGGVEDHAGDVDEAGVVEAVQYGFVQAAPDTSSRPDQKPAVGGRLRYSEAGRQLAPGTAYDEDVDDGREQRLIRGACVPPPCGRTLDGGISGSSGTIQLHVPRPMLSQRPPHHVAHGLTGTVRGLPCGRGT